MDQRGDKASMLNQLSSLQWPWLVAVVLISLATNVVAYSRFFLIARGAANVRIRYWSGLKVNAAATFLGFWTPISISGDVGRVYWLRKNVVESYWDAFLIVLWDRLIALAALVVCMLPFIPLYMGRIAEYFQVDTGLVAAAALGVLGLGSLFAFAQREKFRLPAAERNPTGGRELWAHVVVGFLYVATFYAAMGCAAASLGLTKVWLDLLVVAPLLFFAQNLPMTFGGLGSRELSFMVMLGPVVGSGNAVAMSLVVGFGYLMAALPGAVVLGEFRGDAQSISG